MDEGYQRGDGIDVVNGRIVWCEDEGILPMTVSVTEIWATLARVVGYLEDGPKDLNWVRGSPNFVRQMCHMDVFSPGDEDVGGKDGAMCLQMRMNRLIESW